jgi:hypothetical protein
MEAREFNVEDIKEQVRGNRLTMGAKDSLIFNLRVPGGEGPIIGVSEEDKVHIEAIFDELIDEVSLIVCESSQDLPVDQTDRGKWKKDIANAANRLIGDEPKWVAMTEKYKTKINEKGYDGFLLERALLRNISQAAQIAACYKLGINPEELVMTDDEWRAGADKDMLEIAMGGGRIVECEDELPSASAMLAIVQDKRPPVDFDV